MLRKRFKVSVLLLATLALGTEALSAAQPVELRRQGNTVQILVGGKVFTTYYFGKEVAKPFFMPLRSAQGTVVSRDFPLGNQVPADHQRDRDLEPHQRGMYFAHGNVDGMDFWGEEVFNRSSDDSVFGRTVFRKFEALESGPESGTLSALFDLLSPSGRAIAQEIQSFVFRGDENTRTIDCVFTLLANQGAAVTLGDTKEGTFAIRLAPALNAPPATMVNSAGAHGEKEIWGRRADWVDYFGNVDGEEVGVAIFDHPSSFRHPTYWHARGYGLFAANPFGWREFTRDPQQDGSWTIPQHQSLVFRYRVFIHHGDTQQARVAEAYAAYAHEK